MLKHISNVICALAIGGGLAFGVVSGTACDDDDDGGTGTGGTGGGFAGRGGAGSGGLAGRGGGAGTAGTAGTTGTAGMPGDGGASTDGAATMTYTVPLTGAEEVPPVSTSATGTTTVTLDQATMMVSVSGDFSGLSSTATAAHIHGPAMPGMNAPILVPLTVPSATSGTVTGSGPLTAAQMADLLAGRMYVNVHSMTYPMGEIRGQID